MENWTYLSWAEGGVTPPPPSPLGYTPVKIKQEITRVLLKKNKTAKRNKNLLCELKKNANE